MALIGMTVVTLNRIGLQQAGQDTTQAEIQLESAEMARSFEKDWNLKADKS